MARFFVLALSAVLWAGVAQAQPAGRAPAGAPGQGKAAEPPAPAPTTLDSLHERLAKARDAAEASAIAKQIERRWMRSGSDTADLLMSRAQQVMSLKDADLALELFDHIVQIRPKWAEVYHKRALLLFQMNDIDGAMRDIRQALTLEPRHFGALSGLGMIYDKMDNRKAALAAFGKALDIHPFIESLRDYVDKMRPEIEGRKA